MKKKIRVNTFAAFHYDVAYLKTFSGYLDMTLRIIDAGLKLLEQYPTQDWMDYSHFLWPTFLGLARASQAWE